ANQLALVLSREKTFREFENAYRDTLHTTVDALELSRPELRGHHRRVADLACGIADSIGLRPESIRALEDAARVHDVGLLGGPDAMVNAALEFQHPELGAAMLSALPNGDTLARIVMEHHETFDGFGFPKNLSGDQISQEGAILGLAEFVVERTSANPVGGAESFQTAAQRLQEESGQRFSATLARSAHQHLLKIAEAPFLPGDCARIKGRPADACNGCPAASAKVPCWELEASGRRCGRHGDKDCEGCVVYQTWGRPKE
ncbi:MAG: HD domain-containing phosphohydrolase, partial [Myxococcota bacterium]